MSGTTLPILIKISNLETADTPVSASDLLVVEQGGIAKKLAASTVLPGGTVEANVIYAGPASGADAVPAFRLLVAADLPGTIDSTVVDGTLDATALTVGGNSVLRYAQQGTVTVYGGLVIGANLTLDAGGTLSAAGGGAGSGTVDIGTAQQVAYYAASSAQVGGATYVSIGGGSAAGILVLGQASTRSGGIIMSDALSANTGTLTIVSTVIGLVGGAGAGTVDGTGIALSAGNAAATGNGGDITFTVGTTVGGSRAGQLRVVNVPTADSAVANSVWWDNGVLVQTGHTATATGTVVVAGVLSGGTIVGSGTIGLAVGAGLTSGSGTISNSGVIQLGTLTGTIALGSGLSQASGTLANAGVIQLGTATGTIALSSVFSVTSGTLTASGLLASANNLSDVTDANLARRNINQGTAALSAASASVATNAALGNVFTVTLVSGTGPYTLANPSNLLTGATYLWVIKQPASGSAQTMVYGSAYKFAAPYTNASPPALTAALSAIDVLVGVYDGTNIYSTLNQTFS